MLLADLLKGVGLYFDGRNPADMLELVWKEKAAAKTIWQGVNDDLKISYVTIQNGKGII